jgi:hypothetical protein
MIGREGKEESEQMALAGFPTQSAPINLIFLFCLISIWPFLLYGT